MSAGLKASGIELDPTDRLVRMAVYFPGWMLVGQQIQKQAVRPSMWLRTVGLPDFVSFYDVTRVAFSDGGVPVVEEMLEITIALSQILAMHVLPPSTEVAEFDPSEQNRKFAPVRALTGPFRFEGSLRLPQHLTVGRQLSIYRDVYIPMYDLEVFPEVPQVGALRAPIALVRTHAFSYIAR